MRNLGAELVPEGTRFTAWAPEKESITVTIYSSSATSPRTLKLAKVEDGYFTGVDSLGRAGDRYDFTVDVYERLPDLASRFQPEGLAGRSEVVNPLVYQWQATQWNNSSGQGQVIYELHVGTFTQEGTFQAARQRLDYLVKLGITTVELMPVAQCTGTRNWGYDAVLLFAPYHVYGSPDDMRAFIDDCHLHGLAVTLDVVYNHIGAIGDITHFYSRFLSHINHSGSWGKGFNLDGEHSAPVRHLLLQNVEYWLKDFRIDGYRLDATHAIEDQSDKHLMTEVSHIIHKYGAYSIAEDERRSAEILKPLAEGGWGLDAVWADDFHHATRRYFTRETGAPIGRYVGSLEEMADILQHGWYYRGDAEARRVKPHSTPCEHLSPDRFVYYISNHDQVGNQPYGDRLNEVISPEAYRALSLFFCFIPYTPLIFMGQEWGATTPFLYFTDHHGTSGAMVSEARKQEAGLDEQTSARPFPDCQAESTFESSKLNWSEVDQPPHQNMLALYREALQLRQKLFGRTNPLRNTWKISATSDRLTVLYDLGGQKLEVSLQISPGSEGEHQSDIILHSNDPRFCEHSLERLPKTVIRLIASG